MDENLMVCARGKSYELVLAEVTKRLQKLKESVVDHLEKVRKIMFFFTLDKTNHGNVVQIQSIHYLSFRFHLVHIDYTGKSQTHDLG